MKKRFYGYNYLNGSLDPKDSFPREFVAFLSIPLAHFKKTSGCTDGNAYKLKKSSIGKMFEVSILDPVFIGKCKYLGRGFNAIPKSDFKTAIKKYEERINNYRKFLVFEHILNDEKVYIVVEEIWCDANPVKAKK